jgi:hypothetical protein
MMVMATKVTKEKKKKMMMMMMMMMMTMKVSVMMDKAQKRATQHPYSDLHVEARVDEDVMLSVAEADSSALVGAWPSIQNAWQPEDPVSS